MIVMQFVTAKIKIKTMLLLFMLSANLVLTANVYAKHEKPQMPPPAVEVIKVQTSTTQDQLTATGNLIAIPGIVVKSETAGRITNIYFTSGSKVKAGTPLLEIYPGIVRAKLSQARAELKPEQRHFDRMAELHKTHVVSEEEYDQAKSKLESTQARVEELQAELDKTIVRAPFDGSLGVGHVSLGQFVNIGQDIVSLQALDPIYVDFTIPEMHSSKIAIGESLHIHSSSYPKETFGGTVNAIDPLVDKNTRSLTVRAAIANKEEKLLPGTFAEVNLFIGSPKQVIKIPQTAIVHDQNENYVYKVIDGKAVKTLVKTGQHDAEAVVIESGLKIDDIVVSEGQMKIHQDGSPVTVVPTSKT